MGQWTLGEYSHITSSVSHPDRVTVLDYGDNQCLAQSKGSINVSCYIIRQSVKATLFSGLQSRSRSAYRPQHLCPPSEEARNSPQVYGEFSPPHTEEELRSERSQV